MFLLSKKLLLNGWKPMSLPCFYLDFKGNKDMAIKWIQLKLLSAASKNRLCIFVNLDRMERCHPVLIFSFENRCTQNLSFADKNAINEGTNNEDYNMLI